MSRPYAAAHGEGQGTTNSRLSVDDWVQAGFAILAEEGIKALTIDRLCRRLGVTKGGFYWHFTDIAGYRAALVQAWGELRVLMPAVSAAASTTRSSWPDWPTALRTPSDCAGFRPPRSTTSSRRGFTELLVPVRYGGIQADFPAILDPVRRMAHGCASSAWTIGFYAPHNWILRT